LVSLFKNFIQTEKELKTIFDFSAQEFEPIHSIGYLSFPGNFQKGNDSNTCFSSIRKQAWIFLGCSSSHSNTFPRELWWENGLPRNKCIQEFESITRSPNLVTEFGEGEVTPSLPSSVNLLPFPTGLPRYEYGWSHTPPPTVVDNVPLLQLISFGKDGREGTREDCQASWRKSHSEAIGLQLGSQSTIGMGEMRIIMTY
jgi:hypothetical protein